MPLGSGLVRSVLGVRWGNINAESDGATDRGSDGAGGLPADDDINDEVVLATGCYDAVTW